MRTLIIGGVMAAALLGGSAAIAFAQENDGPEGWLLRHGDTNKDGAISREEFMAKAAEHFAKLDTNKDGKISLAEFKAVREMHHPEPGRRGPHGPGGPDGGADGGPGGRQGGAMGMMPPPGGPGGNMLARLDTNGDGKISRAEFAAPGDKRFDLIDTNHDGQIDQAEMDAERERVRAAMQEMGGWRRGPGGPGAPGAPGADMPPPPPPPPGNDK